MATFSSLMQDFKHSPIVEIRLPAPYSHRPKSGWALVTHRFPVKGGISQRDAWARLMSNPNLLFYSVLGEECPPRYIIMS
jgi:hypothetical protein